ncbi:MAG: MATE family efflux transporter [Steroidobacteraceae bacterium]|nr:MATE family efflux transporter [Steroidobacteraceae bacterium]
MGAPASPHSAPGASTPAASVAANLPARRYDARGRAHVDYRAVLLLAGPLIANSAVQAIMNLTDTWFVGRVSTTATAAVGAVYWPILCVLIFLGGVAMAVQTLAAHAHGAGRYRRAAQATWAGIYASLLTIPLFALAAYGGGPLLAIAGLDPEVQRLALEYWWPRLLAGGPVGLLVWALTSFFNGIGRARVTLLVTGVMAVSNVFFNEWFMFGLGLGVAGAAWGTVAANALGLVVAGAFFLGPRVRQRYRPELGWRHPQLARQFRLGLPMGLTATADMLGLALFQLMLTASGTVAGATSQIVVMVTSIAYMPGVGIAMAGTTLVGQAIGAGDRDWAARLGNRVILLAVGFMSVLGFAFAIAGPWLMPLFVNAADPNAEAAVALGVVLLWIAATYQAFDGLQLGCSFCLRGAGDVRVPAVLVATLAWLGWVPATHMLTFAPGEGWVDFLPQFGYGAVGGWIAAVVYVIALGAALGWRWRSGAWRRLRV